MKLIKIVVIMLLLGLVISMTAPGTAQGETRIVLPVLAVDSGAGGAIEALIHCTAPGECSGFNIELTFDPAVIQVVNAEAGPYLGAQVFQAVNEVDNAGGVVRLSAAAVGELPTEAEGVLFRVNFTALTPGQSSLELTRSEVANATGNLAPVAYTGGMVSVLTASGLPAAFSNPEWLIAFATERDGNPEIYTMRPDGTELYRVTDHPASDTYPAWSPDGTQIAFVSDRDGNPEIYVMNADGSGVMRLTDDPATDLYPVWSPYGNRIAFVSDREGSPALFLMDPDGANVERLSDASGMDSMPDWIPNGSRLAFSTARNGQLDLYTMRPDGQEIAPLAMEAGREYWHPVWSPDGGEIAFVSGMGDEYFIYAMQANGNAIRQLTDQPDRITRLDWSPDGQWIVFASERAGNSELFIMDAFGQTAYRITDEPAEDYDPAWKPVAQPCAIRTDREDVPVRVGPGFNRAIFTTLPPNQDFFVLGQYVTGDGTVWWNLDKTQIPRSEAAASLWVASSDVMSTSGCPGVPLVDAPPVIVQITPTPPGQWGGCGSCNTCGHDPSECVLSPDGQCLWDPRTCRGDTPPPECIGIRTGVSWQRFTHLPPADLQAVVAEGPNCGNGFYQAGMTYHVGASPLNPTYWTGTCPRLSDTGNPIQIVPTSTCSVIAVFQ
ncbi:MAG: hypothetical protein Kow0077_15390 [Anaerolineae bacterium]